MTNQGLVLGSDVWMASLLIQESTNRSTNDDGEETNNCPMIEKASSKIHGICQPNLFQL